MTSPNSEHLLRTGLREFVECIAVEIRRTATLACHELQVDEQGVTLGTPHSRAFKHGNPRKVLLKSCIEACFHRWLLPVLCGRQAI